jgi:phospholipid-translocating ATPase
VLPPRSQLNGIYAALINYYLIIHGCTPQAFARSGRPAGMYDIGSTMYTSILWTVTFQMCLAIGYWTWVHHLFIWGSMALWYLFCLAYNALPTNIVPNVHKALVEVGPHPGVTFLFSPCSRG